MTLVGLDFDNTLVRYDRLFYNLALERHLISKDTPMDKIEIRNSLRKRGLEEDFTLLQGEVYGPEIINAEAAPGMLKALNEINDCGIKMVLVSHKTKHPYKGPNYNLHKSAILWLERHQFLSEVFLDWEAGRDIFFEQTKEKKIERILELGCTHYIDDLPEILDRLPESIKRILYDPNSNYANRSRYSVLESWEDAKRLIVSE